jgi:hypothetical protein
LVSTGPARDRHVVAAVGAGGVERAAREHDGRERDVGAAVDVDLDQEALQRPVALEARQDPRAARVALGRRPHVLETVVDELHRPAGLLSPEGGMPAMTFGYSSLPPKAPAGHRLDDPHLSGGRPSTGPERLVDVVRALHRAPHRDAVLIRPARDDALRLDVELLLGAGLVGALDHDGRRQDRPRRIAARDMEVLEDVVLAVLRVALRGGGEAVVDREHGRQRHDVELDQAAAFSTRPLSAWAISTTGSAMCVMRSCTR